MIETTNIRHKILAEYPSTTGNLDGLIPPFMGQKLRGEKDYRFIAVEPELCPSFTRRKFALEAAEQFAGVERILPASESVHAIRAAIDEVLKCKEIGEEKMILFGMTGTSYFDMAVYEKFHDGAMTDYILTDEDLLKGFDGLSKVDK